MAGQTDRARERETFKDRPRHAEIKQIETEESVRCRRETVGDYIKNGDGN